MMLPSVTVTPGWTVIEGPHHRVRRSDPKTARMILCQLVFATDGCIHRPA